MGDYTADLLARASASLEICVRLLRRLEEEREIDRNVASAAREQLVRSRETLAILQLPLTDVPEAPKPDRSSPRFNQRSLENV